MSQHRREFLLWALCLIVSGHVWAYDEFNPHEYTEHTGSEDHVLVWRPNDSWRDMVVSPDHPTVQVKVCYKDEEGNDSWLDGHNFSIRMDGEQVAWVNKNQKNVPFTYPGGGYSGVINTYDIGHQGSDRFFSDVYMTFKYVQMSMPNFNLGFYGNYNHNRDGWHWCGRSYYTYTSVKVSKSTTSSDWLISYMGTYISMNSNRGIAPHKACITMKDGLGWSYPHGLLFSKDGFANKNEWVDPSQVWQSVRVDNGDGLKSLDFNYAVESDYVPQTYQLRCYVNGEEDSYFYKDFSTTYRTPYFQKATGVNVQFNQWNKRCTLSWNAEKYDSQAGTDGRWMVLRSTDGVHYSYVGNTNADTKSYTDVMTNNLPYDTQCTYKVAFVPAEWGTPSSSNWSVLLSEELAAVGSCVMDRHFSIRHLRAEGDDKEASFMLAWQTDIIDAGGTGAFHIWRKDSYVNRWEEVTTQTSKRNCTDWTAIDRLEISAARAYSYYVSIDILDTTFCSDVLTHQRLQKPDGVEQLTASKGAYSGSVRLNWTARQSASDAVTYTLLRRPAGMDGMEPHAWTRLYTTRGTDSYYSYTDQSLSNGVFYEYKVISEAKAYLETGESIDSIACTNYGFASLTGVISGQITYGSGTAVADARVSIKRKSDSEAMNVCSHSIRCEGGGILWTPAKEPTNDWFRKRDWTIQFFVRPDRRTEERSILLQAGSMELGLRMSDTTAQMDINGKILAGPALALDDWNCVTVAFTKNKTATVSVVNARNRQPVAATLNKALSEDPFEASSAIVLGGGAEKGFFGYIDDVRIFGARALSVEESASLADRMLSGNERNLVAYWPLDEGITNQQDAYDYSTNAGAVNENHGTLLPSTHISDLVPPSEMLDYYAITDADGNYIIRGVPYNGSGTNYTVTPSLWPHAFSPASQDRYISATSLVYSGTDFTDISSFPVTITVTYDGTSYPVDEVSVSIDGTPVGKDGNLLTTDIDGKVTVDVPIGSHYISVSRNGHTFVGGGRFPENGTHTFTSKAELNFYDNTTAIFAGRVVGGSNNSSQPLGFAQSENLIGKASIQLMVTREGVGINNDNATGRPLASQRSFRLPQQEWLGCTAASLSENTIEIVTDGQSGEFAVALPPIHYTVVNVQVANDKEGSIRFSDIPPVDLTDVTRSTTDSIVTGSGVLRFEYNKSLILTHRTKPMVEITPKGRNWFGEQLITKYDANSDTYCDVTCYDTEAPEGANPYVFGYPIYRQLNTYRMKVKVFERYHNFDSGIDKDDPLGSASLRIDNAMSDSCWVTADEGTMALLASDTIRLDSLGQAEYRFRAGLPNITAAEGFRRPITVYCNVDGETILMDDIPYMEGIVLGSLPVPGSDFVTAGPDFIDMVLRDPPGNNSYATWRSGSTIAYSSSETGISRDGRLYDNAFSVAPTVEYNTGVGLSITTTICPKIEYDTHITHCTTTSLGDGYERRVTLSEDISTSNDANWDGPDADVFIGTSSNRLFCKSHVVDLRRNTDGRWAVSVKDELTDGLQFTTDFRFTAWEIKNQQIPKLRELRDAIILEPQEWNEGMLNATDRLLYWSPVLKAGDKGFGEKGNYQVIEPSDKNRELVLTDSVDWYNTCITNWQNRLRDNERDKVLAFAGRDKYLLRNISISDGVSDRNSVLTENTFWESEEINREDAVNMVVSGGLLICGVGDIFESTWIDETNFISAARHDTTLFNEFSYELLTKGLGNALTVDILDPSKARTPEDSLFVRRTYSPIFRTRGGSTSGYYEPEYRAEFYEPEKKHLVMEGTVQSHVPELTGTDGVYLYTGIPAESTAKIHLTMKNQSGIGLNGYYTLYLDAGSNPEGASYTVDGTPLEQGVSYYFTYGQPLYATVECRQVNPDILEYNPVFYLADPDQPVWTGVHGAIADSTVREKAIHIEFARMSSHIDLSCDASYVNASTPEGKVPVTLSGYNHMSTRLRTISLEYYNTALDTWTTLRAWTRYPELEPDLLPLASDVTSITTDIDFNDTPFLTDRTYRFRAATTSWFGNEKATTYSPEISIVKDREAPRVMAVSPADGWMNAATEVSVTFNEDIDESITASNVHLRGVLASQPVAHEVSLNTNSTSQISDSEVLFPDGTGSITLWMKRMKEVESGSCLFAIDGENGFEAFARNGRFEVNAGRLLVSSDPLPGVGEWTCLVISFERNPETGVTTFSAGYTTDDKSVVLIEPQELPEGYSIRSGFLRLGPNCRFHDVCVWDDFRTINEVSSHAYDQMNAYTPHLLEHWPMDSQQGRIAWGEIGHNDISLTRDADWVIERENYAVLGTQGIRYEIPVGCCSTSEGEDYHIQMWYRFDKVDKGCTMMSYGDSDGRRITVETDQATGNPVLQWNDGRSLIGVTEDLVEGNWYRFDLVAEKSRGKGATIYLDDMPCSLIPYNATPNLEGWLTLGGEGVGICVDEIRIWRRALDEETMRKNMYASLNTVLSDVCLYYPFEQVASQNGTEKTYAFSLHNLVHPSPESDIRVVGAAEPVVESVNVPPVKGVPEISNVGFTLSRSERKFVLNIDEPQQNIEGSTLYAQIQGLKDKAGNTVADDVMWSFQVLLNNLSWNDASLTLCSSQTDEQTVLRDGLCSQTVSFVNNTSVNQGWYITGLPSWLEASTQSGNLKPGEQQAVRFRATGNTLTGTHVGKLYLTESETGISHSLPYSMSYLPDLPDWKVDRADVPNTMNIIGQVTIGNFIQSNSHSLLAAFDSKGCCAGVAAVEYVADYGSSFVQMTLYGDAAETDNLTFSYYDANTGTLYPVMEATFNGNQQSVCFTPDNVLGSFVQPVIFSSTSLIRQTVSSDKEGWDYFSFYVHPKDSQVTAFLDQAVSLPEDLSLRIVHDDGFALYENGTWLTDGTFTQFAPGTAYKLWASAPFATHYVGERINPSLYPITIVPGWNWLGVPISSQMPLAQAFATLKSLEGDFVKDYHAAAICEKVGNAVRWQGKLTALVPGRGYLYHYGGSSPMTFSYPKTTMSDPLSAYAVSAQHSPDGSSLRAASVTPSLHYGNLDTHLSSGVMPVVARVLIDKVPVTKCEVAAFDKDGRLCGEARPAEEGPQGLILLLLHGDENQKMRLEVILSVNHQTVVVPVDTPLDFADGGILGTMAQPYTIHLTSEQINEITGLESFRYDEEELPSYDVLGRRVMESVYNSVTITTKGKVITKKQ